MKTFIYDTETTGFIRNAPLHSLDQPAVVQLAGQFYRDRTLVAQFNFTVVPMRKTRVYIPAAASSVHGITDADCDDYGIFPDRAYHIWCQMADRADRVVCHNAAFDSKVMQIVAHDVGADFTVTPHYCTMLTTTPICKIPSNRGFKWPKLQEAYKILVNDAGFENAHDALVDVRACAEILWALEDRGEQLQRL